MILAKNTIITVITFFILIVVVIFFVLTYQAMCGKDRIASPLVFDQTKVFSALRTTPETIKKNTQQAIKKIDLGVTQLVSGSKKSRATIFAFDRLAALSDAAIYANILEAISHLHPDEAIRAAAQEEKITLSSHLIKQVVHNKEVYDTLVTVFENTIQQKELTKIEHFCIKTILDEFQRNGIHLAPEQREELAQLLRQIEQHATTFTQNISSKRDTVEASKEELSGVSERFLTSLSQTESGKYILTTDYPVYFTVMENCTNQETRKKMYHAFNNRGFPDNEKELGAIIQLRDTMAHLLHFDSYVSYDLKNQMAKEKETVTRLLSELLKKAEIKIQKEVALLKSEAKEAGIALSKEEKLYPWDILFLENKYKKKYLALDETVIAEYFPVAYTIPALFSLYEQFFGITFRSETLEAPIFADDVSCVSIIDQRTKRTLGYLLLDLYPRPHKYSHAAHMTLVPAVIIEKHTETVPVSIVMANFPQKTDTSPALLKRADVQTFFHELGHALHALFGQTTFASFSGTNTKTDFVETPSQMLEEWLYDPKVLKTVSKHYKIGEPLSDEMIAQIIRSKNSFTGLSLQRQTFYSLLALAYYQKAHLPESLFGIMKELYNRTMPEMDFYDQNHFYASFSHLPGYGAKYYGYIYSKVFALDLFDTIKQEGLFESATGMRYKNTILAPGGSQDPEKLLEAFLGRKPSVNAFVKNCCF
jgi:thimet oligopeptidase